MSNLSLPNILYFHVEDFLTLWRTSIAIWQTSLFVCLFVFVCFFFCERVVTLNEELSILLSLVDLENV